MSATRGKVVIFGAHGQVGRALARRDPGGRAVALGRAEVDVVDSAEVGAALDAHRPEVVINTAVFQPVDLCETAPSAAFRVNALGAGNVAAACRERDIRMIHISTDYVFDGAQRQPYVESDCPAPLSVYGRSKLAGEHLVASSDPRHFVARTCSVYGRGRPGNGTAPFVERMLQRALAGEPTRVVTDQVLSPTYADDLADSLWHLTDAPGGGVVHLAGRDEGSWFDLAEAVFGLAGRLDLLSATTAAEFGAPAPRAPYSALASERLAELGLEPLAGWRDGLRRHFADSHAELAGAGNA